MPEGSKKCSWTVWQVLECLGTPKYLYLIFEILLDCTGGLKQLFWSLESPYMSCKIQNIFYDFLKSNGLTDGPKYHSWSLTSLGLSESPNYFSLIFKSLLDCLKVQDKVYVKFHKSRNVLETPRYFSMIFKSLLDCLKVQNNFSEVWPVLECFGKSKMFLYDV